MRLRNQLSPCLPLLQEPRAHPQLRPQQEPSSHSNGQLPAPHPSARPAQPAEPGWQQSGAGGDGTQQAQAHQAGWASWAPTQSEAGTGAGPEAVRFAGCLLPMELIRLPSPRHRMKQTSVRAVRTLILTLKLCFLGYKDW